MPAVVARGEAFPGKLGQQRFDAVVIETQDGRGIAWRGVRQRAIFAHDDLEGIVVETDALTVGGSPLVKLVMRVINPAPASRPLHEAGWMIFVQPDGERGHTSWTDDDQVRHTDRLTWLASDGWLAAENPRTSRTLALVSPHATALAGFGSDGTHFKLLPARPVVPAGGTLTIRGYLALARDLDEARRWVALSYLE